ncbi:MAG: hypothetical protein IAB19_01240 [Proteobacteria bacterium]|uniref:Uncharacterized protein n=1 Tax=Candidatus Avisuccinivibrio stercorigallinarum TaxID=2840704 RepID=A0A9D9D9S7_9GAMM|nr:hypothetical protein [Candidatus Avisuccinivibrio stercorigallinarum]
MLAGKLKAGKWRGRRESLFRRAGGRRRNDGVKRTAEEQAAGAEVGDVIASRAEKRKKVMRKNRIKIGKNENFVKIFKNFKKKRLQRAKKPL